MDVWLEIAGFSAVTRATFGSRILKGLDTIGLTLRASRHRMVRELTVLQIRLRPGSIPCTAGNMGIRF
jgi:hypothetical protein